MTINTLRILTTSGNILEFKIRPSFTLEMEDLIYAILLKIKLHVNENLVIELTPEQFIINQSYYLNPSNLVQWYIVESQSSSICNNNKLEF